MLIPDDATPVALGRQALGLAARRARDAGRRTVLVPQYCCQTMVTPWQLEGLAVRRVEVGADLLMAPASLARALEGCRAAGEHPVILHCETFGVHAGRQLARVLSAAVRTGADLVVDRTHSFLERFRISSGPGSRADPGRGARADGGGAGSTVEVVSTRKLMPIGELGWITGGPRRVAARTAADDELTAARARFLARPTVAAFEAAEDLADSAWTPVPPHPETLAQLRTVDGAGLADRLVATRRAVLTGMAASAGPSGPPGVVGPEVVNPGAVCPLVLRVRRAEEIADALHDRGLDGPIHWDRPENLPVAWPRDLLCLPAVMDPEQAATVVRVLATRAP